MKDIRQQQKAERAALDRQGLKTCRICGRWYVRRNLAKLAQEGQTPSNQANG